MEDYFYDFNPAHWFVKKEVVTGYTLHHFFFNPMKQISFRLWKANEFDPCELIGN
jgi:hypothetical protein